MITSENHIALSLLAPVVQQMVLFGYHRLEPGIGWRDNELHHKRLFWRAFISDHDLSLRMNKPPLIGSNFEVELPEEVPRDGACVLVFENGKTINYLREQVILAKLQCKAYELLYSIKASRRSVQELHASVDEIDNELIEWKQRIPEISRGHVGMSPLELNRLMSLTSLYYTYYQLVIAVHSFTLRGLSHNGQLEDKERIIDSVALCVGAARASISLLNSHEKNHSFTTYAVSTVST
jgi:hypothetical protein